MRVGWRIKALIIYERPGSIRYHPLAVVSSLFFAINNATSAKLTFARSTSAYSLPLATLAALQAAVTIHKYHTVAASASHDERQTTY